MQHILARLEQIVPGWFWKYLYPYIGYLLAVLEVCTGLPTLVRAMLASNMEAMPIETHIFNIAIGFLVIFIGIKERETKSDMFILGLVMLAIYIPTLIVAFARGAIFLWE